MSFPKFQAELVTFPGQPHLNAILTLTLKLGFTQINPDDDKKNGTYHDYGRAAKPTRKIIKWKPEVWETWKTTFTTSAQEFWTNKFWLANTFCQYGVIKDGQTYYPNIQCRLKIIASAGAGASVHHSISVVKLHKSESWFGSHSTLYDSLDTKSVQKGTDSAGKKIMQKAHVHEVGHLLGMPHVDVGKGHCLTTSNTNASACYGVADVDKKSVMGQGMQLRAKQANPWRQAMIGLTSFGSILKEDDWKANIGIMAPRTELEATLGQTILMSR